MENLGDQFKVTLHKIDNIRDVSVGSYTVAMFLRSDEAISYIKTCAENHICAGESPCDWYYYILEIMDVGGNIIHTTSL